jgi:gamma-glutamyl:cysteine ligase YbdK (ATP-grasp superfamily)
VKKILREGNEALRWLQQYEAGQSVQQIMQGAIAEVAASEGLLARDLCEPCAA